MARIVATALSFAKAPDPRRMLAEAGHEVLWNPYGRPLTEDELAELVQGSDALVAGLDAVTAKVFAAGAPKLKIVAKHGVGYDNIDLMAAENHGVTVTNTPGANSQSVAEHTLGLMLSVVRRVSEMDRTLRSGSWKRLTGSELAGKTLGIVGLGSIGATVAKLAKAFDMKLVAYEVAPRPELIDTLGITLLSLPELLATVDIVTLHAPLTPDTRGIINASTLRLMKPGACIINTARGGLVDEQDLYTALREGWIAGAGLDAFNEEPLRQSPLFNLPNVVLTPHAGADTLEAANRTGVMAATEVIRLLAGQPPLNPVRSK